MSRNYITNPHHQSLLQLATGGGGGGEKGLSWIKKFILKDESGKNGTICISIFKWNLFLATQVEQCKTV